MQSQDATTVWLFKLWPWLEANVKKLAVAAAVVLLAALLISYYSWRQEKKEVDAGQAFTQAAMTSDDSQRVDAFLKIAADYPGTPAGQRALLQAAEALFQTGNFADAQAHFQKFLDTYPDSTFASQASLGVAACLSALGKTSDAADAYQRTINEASDPGTLINAKFGLAQIDDRLGKIPDALGLYEDVANMDPGGPFGNEAALRAMELKAKLPATSAPAALDSTFNLNH
ncbi:MAG TPA: tetratricopeptide repeat protein [Candidatus Aquilonibacter sp.]|nr:tetratricopeptide repeat protein [Candidatus Aquilonibacter sp.]